MKAPTTFHDPATAPPGHVFYTSVIDADRCAILTGPFGTHAAAVADVDRARFLAERFTKEGVWCAFYAFGTCSLPRDVKANVLFPSDGRSREELVQRFHELKEYRDSLKERLRSAVAAAAAAT